MKELEDDTQVVAIDEGQFFDMALSMSSTISLETAGA